MTTEKSQLGRIDTHSSTIIGSATRSSVPTLSNGNLNTSTITTSSPSTTSYLPTTSTIGCGSSNPITLSSYGDGIIKSPNYPDSYPNNADCKWQMHRKSNQTLYLKILDFDLEYG